MNTLKNFFGKLRWKLTASYMGVTVGSLLFILLVISIPLFSYILSPIDLLDPEYWIQEIYAGKFVEFMSQFLAQSPPDTFGIRLLINNLEVLTESSYEVFSIGDIHLSFTTSPQLEGAVVDAKGALLGVTLGDLGDTVYDTQDLKSRAYPEVNEIMMAALEGEGEVEKLSIRREAEDTLLLAIPVYENNNLDIGADDKILGAIIVVIKSLPSQEFVPAYIMQLIGSSFVWFLIAAGIVGAFVGFLTARFFENRFKKLYIVADHWSKGDFSTFVEDPGTDELGQLSERMNLMAQQLQKLLAERQALAVSEERNRLARELHDSAKQQAFAAAFHLSAAISKLDRDAGKEEIQSSLSETEAAVNTVRKELTDLIHELRPPEMEGRPLKDAIQDYATDWAHANDIEVAMEVESDQRLELEVKQALYRVVQEALSNIAKHSQATGVELRLVYLEDLVQLEITDDGVGFDLNQPRRGLGLNSMKERVESLNGNFEITSQIGDGTRIKISIPVEDR